VYTSGVRVSKVQAWTNLSGVHHLHVAGLDVVTSATFRMVGVVLGSNERLASNAHFDPHLQRALATTRRLRMLTVPASISALLWRTAVLPQALYGSEIRHITPQRLQPLSRAGQAAVSSQAPLQLNCWRASEIVAGPLGRTAVRDPVLEVRQRQLRWALLIANCPSLVGLVHRHVAWSGLEWKEPSLALASALKSVRWSMRRNTSCRRSLSWPHLAPEPHFPGPISLQPVDSFAPDNTVYTDGSLILHGGAAAVQPATAISSTARLPAPRSSTHCELVALGLGLQLDPPPKLLITDSLVSLHLLKGWGS